jgi:tetratricopeptide (TPR) repeat protein
LAEWAPAVACLGRASALRAGDFALLLALGTAQDHAGEFAAARASLLAAMPCARVASEWLALSLELDRQGHVDEAFEAVQQVLRLDPVSPVALLQRARCARAIGNAEVAAADCRALIQRQQHSARAWFLLVDLKTVRLSAAELAQLEQASTAAEPGPAEERQLLGFAFGKALEDAARYEAAFAVLCQANQAALASHPWDAAAFDRQVALVQSVSIPAGTRAASHQGEELIFLVGLPRSGTTLVEQVLASHSRVEGASELPYLGTVIAEESRRRGQAFPAWVPTATAEDWSRLGQHYLRLSARWRSQRPVCTDKLPDNWLLAGAARAMLPGARFIDCRRDAVETCWSCYKQLFGPGHVGYTYAFETLAAYWRAYDRLTRFWAQAYPHHWHTQHYEGLVAQPEPQIRALLDFCGLPFEPGCLLFHQAQRAIRTPSALQVRQPLRQTSTPAAQYGALMEPLRRLLREAGAP